MFCIDNVKVMAVGALRGLDVHDTVMVDTIKR